MSSLSLTGAGPELAAPFTPLSLSPLIWLDPSDTATITQAGGLVSQINDKSGNGRNFTQGTAGSKPLTGTRTINSLNVLDFDGTDDHVASATGLTQAQPFTVFYVSQCDNPADAGNRQIFSSAPVAVYRNATTWTYFAGSAVGGGVVDGNAHVHEAVFSNPASSLRIVDGTTITSSDPGTGAFAADTIGYGARSGGTLPEDGAGGELLVYAGAMSVGNRSNVRSYLGAKWGITVT